MVGLKGDLTVGVQADQVRVAALVIVGGQRPQQRLLLPPGVANRRRLPGHLTRVIGQTAGQQVGIEFVKRVHLWQGHQKITAVKADTVLDIPLLVPLAGHTKVAFEQVVAAQRDEGLLLLPRMPLQHAQHRRFQIVVSDAMWDSLEMMKRLDVPVKERLLLLNGHPGRSYPSDG